MDSLRSLVDQAYEVNGKYTYSTFRKVFPFASVAGNWVDLSMGTGNPIPNYYIGDILCATTPLNWYKKGFWHGGAVSPDKKFLHKICFLGTNAGIAPAPFILCDYLLYYPLIDMDSTDEQDFTNFEDDPTYPSLPRYTDGIGVQAMLVATNPYIGGQAFRISYKNTRNVTQSSKRVVSNSSTNIATIVNANPGSSVQSYGPFIPLEAGDIGIKRILSIQFEASQGGLAALVLVRPLATLMTREITAFCEFDFIKDKLSLPRIYDGAFLNLITMPSASISTVPVLGEITTIWGS